jgi:hypothetical protein
MPLISYDASGGINENKTRTTTTKITSKNCAINVHHHDDRQHSSEDESRDNPRKFRRQQRQRERKQERRDRQKKAKTSSKHKRSCRDTWNAPHARDTCSTNSASESAGSVRDTVPNKTKQARGTTTANTILVDSTQKTNVGCDVLSCSRSLSCKSSPTKRSEKENWTMILIGTMRSKTLSHQF